MPSPEAVLTRYLVVAQMPFPEAGPTQFPEAESTRYPVVVQMPFPAAARMRFQVAVNLFSLVRLTP
jgi:hypothetical protein